MDIDSTLKNVAPELSPELRKYLIEVGEIEHFEKGGLILDYGIQACFLPIIIDGNARVMRGDEDDPSKELLLYILTPGEICPCAAFSTLPKGEMPITVEAETPAVILNVPIGELNILAADFPEWRMYELGNFRKRFEELLSLVDNAIFKQLGARLRAYIEMRCRVSGQKGVALSKVKMASELGTSREVVSRLLKALEHEGVITQDKDGVHLLQ
ncbi:Crp/Fnr family transcriptional regulator [Schleiferiaceae bacterium]|nr:Crp/Fnr family transcriptional regulator [Schleiferiaceae bacterium]MDB9838377.1 Crp/Fnr family transcriptional regulator [bacterium]MDC1537341.1 Crp/Fnr family transcriptional regulator [Schleiferiaceae bacterium]